VCSRKKAAPEDVHPSGTASGQTLITRAFSDMPDHVDAKPIDAFAEPEPHHVIDRLANLRITPVEVRLPGRNA